MPQSAFAVLLGTLLAFFGNQPADIFWSAYIPMLLLLVRYNPRYRFICLLAVGLLWGSIAVNQQLSHRLHDTFDNRSLMLEASIADIPRVDADRVSLLLKDLHIEAYAQAMPRRVSLNWYRTEQIPKAGERWRFLVRLRQPRGLLNPAGFDYEAWQFVHRIDASGYVLNSKRNQRIDNKPRFSLAALRSDLAANIDRDCAHCRHAGLVKALVLGFRGDIEPQTRQLLQSTGTAHLLAISGLHVGMVALLFYMLGRLGWQLIGFRLGINRREMASLCGFLAAFAYTALAGFSLPTLRALIMLAVVLLGQQLNHKIMLLQSASVALMIILIIDPLAVGSASFWLSFGALLVIAFAQFRLPRQISGWQQLIILQCYFMLLFAPFGMFIFGQFNVASLPANLVAIPLLSLLILPIVLTAIVLSSFWPGAAALLLSISDVLLEYLFTYFDLLLRAGLQAQMVDGYPLLLLLLTLMAITFLLLPRLPQSTVVAVLILGVFLSWQPVRLSRGEFELLSLDVGMGSSLLLRTRHHSLIYDFGPGRKKRFSAADRALLPVMRDLGIERADLLIVSHVDQDHSGGFYSFIDEYQPAQLLSGTPAELASRFELAHRVKSCHDYPDWQWDAVRFRFLDTSAVDDSTNNRSCILQVIGHHRMLLPGDIEALQEKKLVEFYGEQLASDVLIAPHHGSDTSSSQLLIDHVKARQVVFSLARNNHWGFPHESVIARYRETGAVLYRSDHDGAIRFLSKPDRLQVTTSRNPPSRVWRRW